jgi:DNA-binding PadR family transcriptional regulator
MSATLVPLTAQAFQVLLSLADGADLHGYAIIQDVLARTDGEVRLTASTLYAAIKRMVDGGLLVEVAAPAECGGAPRRCYRITRAGRQVAQREAERLARTVAMARDKRLLPRKA